MSRRSIVRARNRQISKGRARRAALGTAAAIGVAVLAPDAHAATFEVTNLGDSGAGSLRDAIDQANGAAGADTITFQSGLSGTIAVAGQMDVTDELTISGPGPGAITLDGGDATRILYASGVSSVSISGLTLTDGSTPSDGGALAIYGGAALLDNLTVTSSSADRGGGVFFGSNDVTVNDSRFSDNYASYTGGGLATDGYFGIAPDDALSITGSTFTDNEAEDAGGGISLYDSYVDVEVAGSTISGNVVAGDGGAYENGGGIWFEDTYDGYATTLRNSTVSGNSAPDAGGGVSFGENFYGLTSVVNSTVHGNDAALGGGIQFADITNTEFTLENSTVTGNSATDSGGGVFRGYATFGNSVSPLDVSSSVVSGNTATVGGADFAASPNASGDLTLGNTLVGDTTGVTYTADPPGSVLVGVDPQLGPLTDNGGETETRLPAPTSPIINAGLANGLTVDQRREVRTVLFPGVPNTLGSDGTDMGAVELAAPPDTVITSGPAEGEKITTDDATFAFAGSPGAATAKLQCKLDSEPFADCTSPKTFDDLSEGSHTVAFRAVNSEGTPDPTPATRTFRVKDVVEDPFLKMKDPQLQEGSKIRLKVKAGAGEDVTAIASGRIKLKHGNAVELESEKVAAGKRVTLVLKPERGSGGNRRIKAALRAGREAVALIGGRLIDDGGNKYKEKLEAELKLKKG
jgi:hypothetical protein